MDNTEVLKTALVDIDSSIKQEIIDQSDNYTLLAAKEEPGIEGHIDWKQTYNSVDIIKQELNENDNGCSLLSIKQEELDIKDENLDQSNFPTECDVNDKTNFNLNNGASNKIQKRFSCTFCDKTYGRKYSLKLHLAKHTGEKSLSCTFCDYKCIRKSYLEYHLAKHTGEKPFRCTFCNYKSISKCNLKSHLATHTGGKQFSCTFCDYKCILKRDLRYHLAKHTGEQSFNCTFCNFKCMKKSYFESHVAKHTGEIPFSCTICMYKSVYKYNLIRHMQSHGVKNPTVKVLKFDLDQNHLNLQNSRKVLMIKEESDIKEEPL